MYGSNKSIDAHFLDIASFKARIRVGDTFGSGETLIIRGGLRFIDNVISNSVEEAFNQTAALWLDDGDYFELTPTQNISREILVDAKTNAMSTNTILQIDVYGTTA